MNLNHQEAEVLLCEQSVHLFCRLFPVLRPGYRLYTIQAISERMFLLHLLQLHLYWYPESYRQA